MTSSFSNNMGGIAEGDMGGTQEKKGRKKVAKACLACQKSHVTCDDRECRLTSDWFRVWIPADIRTPMYTLRQEGYRAGMCGRRQEKG